MSRRAAVAAALAAALLATGCGKDRAPGLQEVQGSPAQDFSSPPGSGAAGSPGAARQLVRRTMSEIESCLAATSDAHRCTTALALGRAQIALGTQIGTVRVAAHGAKGYAVSSPARDGTRFRIVRSADGGTTRTCSPPATRVCSAGGTW